MIFIQIDYIYVALKVRSFKFIIKLFATVSVHVISVQIVSVQVISVKTLSNSMKRLTLYIYIYDNFQYVVRHFLFVNLILLFEIISI